VSLARIIRWEVGGVGAYNRPSSPEEVMAELEKRVGPEGRQLFEQFLRKVKKLEEQQALQANGEGDDL
jgi:hypothetical protein